MGFFLYGAAALLAQLAVLQELRLLFAGHELFLGFSLASWMAWTGAGSRLAPRFAPSRLTALSLWVIPLLLSDLALIRLSKLLFDPGVVIGLIPMLALTIVLIAPAGLAAGLSFTWGCVWAREHAGMPVGAAYFWETLGAVLAGLLYTFGMAGRFGADVLLALTALPAAIATLAFNRSRLRALAALLPVAMACAWIASPMPRLTRAAQWRGYDLAAERLSRYGHYLLARAGGLTLFFEDGVLSGHFPDPPSYEELAHWPLLSHAKPEKALIIGGASTGALAEILKHPVTRVDYVELDPEVIRLLEPALAPADRAALNDPRVRIVHEDGRRWLQHSGRTYDVILLHLPPPVNAQINRLYTFESFRAAAASLRPGGVFAFSAPSSENYLSPETAYFNASLLRTLQSVFPEVRIIAGDPLLMLASRESVDVSLRTLQGRFRRRGIRTQGLVPETMAFRLDEARRAALLRTLQAPRAVALNRDSFPVTYVYAWRVWLAKFVSPSTFLALLALAALPVGLLAALWRRRATLRRSPQLLALFSLGAAGLLFETLLVYSFQALSGYVYWQLGALFAAFMFGLALGSGSTERAAPDDPKLCRAALRLILLVLGVLGLLGAWLLPRFRGFASPEGDLLLFCVLLFVIAVGVGQAFPLAARIAPLEDSARHAGALYAADLWGAAVGALLTSAFLVPLMGLSLTAALAGGALVLVSIFLPRAAD